MKLTPLAGDGCGIDIEDCIVPVPRNAQIVIDAEEAAKYTRFGGEHCDAIIILVLRAGEGGECIVALLVEAKYARRSIASYIADYVRYRRGESPQPSPPGFTKKIPGKLSLCAKLLSKLLNPRYTPAAYLLAVAVPDPREIAVGVLDGLPGHLASRIVEEASRKLLGTFRDRAAEACRSLEGEGYRCRAGVIQCGWEPYRLEEELDDTAGEVCAGLGYKPVG